MNLSTLLIVSLLSGGYNLCQGEKNKNILVVVDSQEDYWSESSSETLWLEGSSPLTKMIPNSVEVIKGNFACETKTFSITKDQRMNWDAIVVTQDWIPYTENFIHLLEDTKGAEVITSLEIQIKKWEKDNKKERIVLRKTTDDWFTFLASPDDFIEKRESDDAIDQEVVHHYLTSFDKKTKFEDSSGKHRSLYEQLLRNGYDKNNTKLSVIGIAMNRCVSKGAAHAMAVGYEVEVIVPATSDREDKHNNYRSPIDDPTCIEENTCNAVDINDEGVKVCSDGKRCEDDEWLKQLYEGYKGGPTDDKILRLLQAAGVNLCVNAAENQYEHHGKLHSEKGRPMSWSMASMAIVHEGEIEIRKIRKAIVHEGEIEIGKIRKIRGKVRKVFKKKGRIRGKQKSSKLREVQDRLAKASTIDDSTKDIELMKAIVKGTATKEEKQKFHHWKLFEANSVKEDNNVKEEEIYSDSSDDDDGDDGDDGDLALIGVRYISDHMEEIIKNMLNEVHTSKINRTNAGTNVGENVDKEAKAKEKAKFDEEEKKASLKKKRKEIYKRLKEDQKKLERKAEADNLIKRALEFEKFSRKSIDIDTSRADREVNFNEIFRPEFIRTMMN